MVEQVWRLGAEAGHCDVRPVGAVTVGLAGERLAELGAMADSAARVRVFSDDGNCVSDALLMRRALEYVKAFDGVIAQHAQEPRLTASAQMNEGVVSARLGLAGWPAVAEEAIIARDVLLAGHVGSRLHVVPRLDRRVGGDPALGEVEGLAGDRGGDPAPPAAHRRLRRHLRPVFKVNPPLRTAEDVEAVRAALADGTIDCVATDHAPHALEDKETEWAAARPGMLGLETALSVVVATMVEPGRLTWGQLADRMSMTPALIAGVPDQGRPLAPGRSGDPDPGRFRRPVDGGSGPAGQPQPQHALRRAAAAGAGHGDVPARPADRPRWEDRMSASASLPSSSHVSAASAPRRRTVGRTASGRICCSRWPCLVVAALAGLGMWRGWRRRVRHGHPDLPPLPQPPAVGERGARARAAVPGLYVGTVTAEDWLDRVAADGLSRARRDGLQVTEQGRSSTGTAAGPVWLPVAALRSVRIDEALAGHVMGPAGLLVIGWRHGPYELESGFRADDRDTYAPLIGALRAILPAQGPDVPYPQGPPPTMPAPRRPYPTVLPRSLRGQSSPTGRRRAGTGERGSVASRPPAARAHRAAAGSPRPGGRPGVPRRGVRRAGPHHRRGRLRHRHDRLPGDADRPQLPRSGRRPDRSAHRQHRHERRGSGVAPDLGGRLRGARPVPYRQQLAGAAVPGGRP